MEIIRSQCVVCGEEFTYVRYRKDRLTCSARCRNRRYYVQRGTYGDRKRRSKMSAEEYKEHKKEYDREYVRRDYVRERRVSRDRARYATEEYRASARDRYRRVSGSGYHSSPLHHGYTGHRWFELVREYVGEPPAEDSVFFDRWAERMGVAVLALLEGGNIKEALDNHKKREYIAEYRTSYLSDWTGENEYKQALIGIGPSAEEEALKGESITFTRKEKYSHGKNRPRYGRRGPHPGRTAPTRRRAFKEYQDRPGNRR